MSLTVNQHYGGQAVVRNHYYGSRLYQPNPYPHGSKPQKRTWNMHTFPNPVHPPYPLPVRVPVYTPWPIAAPPAPIIINNCACVRSSPISTSIPAPGPAQPPTAMQIDSGAIAPPYGFEAEESAGPAKVRQLAPSTSHQPATGVRARDILPTVRPPRGARVETPPLSPPPRSSTRHKATYNDGRFSVGGTTPVHRFSTDEDVHTVNQACDSSHESMRHGTPGCEPHTREVYSRDILSTARPARLAGGLRPPTPPHTPFQPRPPHPESSHVASPFAEGIRSPGPFGHTPFIANTAGDPTHVEVQCPPDDERRYPRVSEGRYKERRDRVHRTAPENSRYGGFTPAVDRLSRPGYAATRSTPAPPLLSVHQSYGSPNNSHKPPSATQVG
ncbi:hypothetical protein PENSPDRAFT_654974 [Peniophora sp. CONT]|nr:hypothetical protein PENSPDRAFT_654974 [Peniophora sp. CONT]